MVYFLNCLGTEKNCSVHCMFDVELGCRLLTVMCLQVYLDAFGGDPVVSSEVGAEPKDVDDPELLMPTGTCEMVISHYY